MKPKNYRYCGRLFSEDDLKQIQKISRSSDHPNRAEISRRVCRSLGWLRVDGRLKDMSCRVALLRMYRNGLIDLPPPTKTNANGRIKVIKTVRSDPGEIITGSVGDLSDIHLQLVNNQKLSGFWNELIERTIISDSNRCRGLKFDI